jgi:hypothetical protein
MVTGRALVIQGDTLALPLPDECVDLIVSSPPFFQLRQYETPGIGLEATPAEYLAALWAATAEMVRVLKPSGSLFVELDDKYSERTGGKHRSSDGYVGRGEQAGTAPQTRGPMEKSLLGLPWRYAIGCIDQLDLILRAEIVWEHVNGLPESVRDRVRRGHSRIFHLTKSPRYYSALDTLREPAVRVGPRVAAKAYRDGSQIPGREHDGQPSLATSPNHPLGSLPGSVWSIPSDPLRLPAWLGVDHYACVDADTEILTREGWKRWDEHTEVGWAGQEVAGYNLDTGLAEWTRVHGMATYQHDGPMMAVEKRDLSMRLTTNHRTLVRRHHGRAHILGPVEVVTADQLGPQHSVPRSAEWVPDQQAKSIGVDLAALCGWVAAEGWYSSVSTVYLSQSKTANPEHVQRIDDLISRLHYTPVATTQRWRQLVGVYRKETQCTWRGRPWVDVQWRLPLGLAQEVRRLMPAKLLTAELANLVENEARALLEAFIAGDGHVRGDRISIFQKHRANLDWLQMIAVRLGYKTTLRYTGGRWVLYLTKGGRPITLRGTNGTHEPMLREHYRGVVWCPMTGTGTFIARRNGSVFITGNSFPPELPRRLILGWSPPGICLECGEGRRPVVDRRNIPLRPGDQPGRASLNGEAAHGFDRRAGTHMTQEATILGWACSCTPCTDFPERAQGRGFIPDPSDKTAGASANGSERNKAYRESLKRPPLPVREYHLDGWRAPPTRPAIVLDPFSGVGTTCLVARALGRIGIGVDLSHSYSRAARWRVFESGDWQQVIERTTGRKVKPLPKHDPAQARLL